VKRHWHEYPLDRRKLFLVSRHELRVKKNNSLVASAPVEAFDKRS
jgi:hypothetical protein